MGDAQKQAIETIFLVGEPRLSSGLSPPDARCFPPTRTCELLRFLPLAPCFIRANEQEAGPKKRRHGTGTGTQRTDAGRRSRGRSCFLAKYGLSRRGKLPDSTARVFLESGELPGRYITNSRALITILVSVWHETNHESLYSYIYYHHWQKAAGWSNRPSMTCGSSPKTQATAPDDILIVQAPADTGDS